MQVLSYTNYHPGLIQLFCKKLLENVYSRRTPPAVPYELSSDEIESAKLAVREVMRDRFNLTLGVDKNNYYRVIACTVILDQLANTESTARLYSPRTLLAMAREAWPAAFNSMSEESFRAKLAEMLGMGVLSQTRDGDLRLRSPRVVPLMGTPQSIKHDLEEIAGRPAPAEFDTDSYHVLLGGQPQRYSPLTFAQESALNQSSVGIVFASYACGLTDLEAALQRFSSFGAPSNVSVFDIVPQVLDSLERWLTSRWQAIEKAERIVLFHRLPALDSLRLAERINSGCLFVQKHHASKRSTRLIFVLDPKATWNWSNLDEKRRCDLEKKLALAAIRPWSRAGIRQRLDASDIAVNDDTLSALYDATGGWHILLDELLKSSKPTTDLAADAERFQALLSDRGSELYRRFTTSLGFDAHPELLAVLQGLKALSNASGNALSPTDVTIELLNLYLSDKKLPPDFSDAKLNAALMCLERLGCVGLGAGSIEVDRFIGDFVAAI
jgi:hypothetical protein